MKYLASLVLALAVARATPTKRDLVLGIDVGDSQGTNIDWNAAAANGVKFAYVEDTVGTSYQSSSFNDQYHGAANAGLFYGAYHVALPDASSGDEQASYFYNNGGGWSPNGYTLPGAGVFISNHNGDMCYGLSPGDMVSWVWDFVHTYQGYTGRYPVIYTSTEWWNACTNNDPGFGNNGVPLGLVYSGSTYGNLPDGWSYYTFWQYTDNAYPNPGGGDYFNGNEGDLQNFVNGY